MESFSSAKLIKSGFWIGVGFTVPLILATFIGSVATLAFPSLWQPRAADIAETTAVETAMDDFDRTDSIRINAWRESGHGKQLLILGVIENTGKSSAGSIELEAELLNQKKELVYECSEYVSKKLKPGETENFQITCGCGQVEIPAHASTHLRVVKASAF